MLTISLASHILWGTCQAARVRLSINQNKLPNRGDLPKIYSVYLLKIQNPPNRPAKTCSSCYELRTTQANMACALQINVFFSSAIAAADCYSRLPPPKIRPSRFSHQKNSAYTDEVKHKLGLEVSSEHSFKGGLLGDGCRSAEN
jgi:hypothetical protein